MSSLRRGRRRRFRSAIPCARAMVDPPGQVCLGQFGLRRAARPLGELLAPLALAAQSSAGAIRLGGEPLSPPRIGGSGRVARSARPVTGDRREPLHLVGHASTVGRADPARWPCGHRRGRARPPAEPRLPAARRRGLALRPVHTASRVRRGCRPERRRGPGNLRRPARAQRRRPAPVPPPRPHRWSCGRPRPEAPSRRRRRAP